MIAQLIDRLGWRVEQHTHTGGANITLHIATNKPSILIIDDNEGLVELLERYLTGHTCRVVSAKSGREGLRLAETVKADAIVLDVMMPGMDGWELLQRLRAAPATAAVPVIVCSVFNDPKLAYSLGASLFLNKPVSRSDVLGALRQLGIL
jgi:CheY-like chemotaxis protein